MPDGPISADPTGAPLQATDTFAAQRSGTTNIAPTSVNIKEFVDAVITRTTAVNDIVVTDENLILTTLSAFDLPNPDLCAVGQDFKLFNNTGGQVTISILEGSIIGTATIEVGATGTFTCTDNTNDAGDFYRSGGGGAGEVNTGSNVGTGEGNVFKTKNGVDLEHRTIKQGTNITITQNADDVTIDSTGGGVTNFTGLVDSPNNYAGAAGYNVKVNGVGNALEFVAGGSGASKQIEVITDTLLANGVNTAVVLKNNNSDGMVQALEIIGSAPQTITYNFDTEADYLQDDLRTANVVGGGNITDWISISNTTGRFGTGPATPINPIGPVLASIPTLQNPQGIFPGCRMELGGTPVKILSITDDATSPLNMLTTESFGILGSAINNTEISTVTGDIGYGAGGYPTTIAAVSGATSANDATYTQANADLITLLAQARAISCDIVLAAAMGGTIQVPGVHCITGGAAMGTNMILNGAGFYMFVISGTFGTTAGVEVTLTNGADASNVFLVVGGAVTIGAGCVIRGNILSDSAITIGAGSTIEGRALCTGITVFNSSTAEATSAVVANAIIEIDTIIASSTTVDFIYGTEFVDILGVQAETVYDEASYFSSTDATLLNTTTTPFVWALELLVDSTITEMLPNGFRGILSGWDGFGGAGLEIANTGLLIGSVRTTGGVTQSTGTHNITKDVFQKVVLEVQGSGGGDINVYVNGILVVTKLAYAGTLQAFPNNFYIGTGALNTPNQEFKGKMRNIELFQGTASLGEIQAWVPGSGSLGVATLMMKSVDGSGTDDSGPNTLGGTFTQTGTPVITQGQVAANAVALSEGGGNEIAINSTKWIVPDSGTSIQDISASDDINFFQAVEIDSVTSSFTANGEKFFVAHSDDGARFFVIERPGAPGTGFPRNIVSNDNAITGQGSVWAFRDGASVWAAASADTASRALNEAVEYANNQNDETFCDPLNGNFYQDGEWDQAGGDAAPVIGSPGNTFAVAVGLRSNSGGNPRLNHAQLVTDSKITFRENNDIQIDQFDNSIVMNVTNQSTTDPITNDVKIIVIQ